MTGLLGPHAGLILTLGIVAVVLLAVLVAGGLCGDASWGDEQWERAVADRDDWPPRPPTGLWS